MGLKAEYYRTSHKKNVGKLLVQLLPIDNDTLLKIKVVKLWDRFNKKII